MELETISLIIVGMAAVTYLTRLLPTWLLASRPVPEWLAAWLRNVPVAVLSAMLFPTIITQQKELYLAPDNLFLLATLPTLLVAWKTRSLFGSVVAGVVVVAIARLLSTT